MDAPDDRPDNLPAGDVGDAIYAAAKKHGMDPRVLGGIASIESSFTPGSNYNKPTQYKGLFQIGRDEWRQYGGSGNIYNAADNADAAAHMLRDHSDWFQQNYGREPSPAELYMMHQQGRGFFSDGAQTNFAGNTPSGFPVARSSQQHMDQWGQVLDKRMNAAPGTALPYAADGTLDPALAAIKYATRNRNGNAMADPNTIEGQRALWKQQLGGIGPALQDAGAFLMAPGGASVPTNHAAAFMEQSKPQVIDGGVDPINGQKILYTMGPGGLRPLNIAGASPAGGGGAPSGVPSMAGAQQALNDFQAGRISKEDLVRRSGMVGDYAKNLTEGSENPTLFGMARAHSGFGLLGDQIAHAIDPTYNPNMMAARQQEYKNMINRADPKTIGGMAASYGAAAQHGKEAIDLSDQIADLMRQNGISNNYAMLNKGYNLFKTQGADQLYKTLLNRRDTALDSYSREMDKVLTNGNPTEGGRKDLRAHFNGDMSSDEIAGAIGQLSTQGREKLEPFVFNRNKAFGRLGTDKEEKVEDIMSPDSVQAMQSLKNRMERVNRPPAPSGGGPSIVNPQTGHRMFLRDGRWQE